MGNLVLTGATSGSATVQATDAQTVTITLPATSGTLALTSGGGSPTYTTITTTNDATISGLTVGKGGGAVSSNTAVGASALANSTGSSYGLNAFGYQSLIANTSGNSNNSFGSQALASNTTGSSLVAIGHEALKLNTTASYNTAVGYQAGYSNTTGQYNTTIGYQSGQNITTGVQNTFVGILSGQNITTGTRNTIIGRYDGNQGGLDIRTSSNYIVLSDGDGNPRLIGDGSGNFMIGLTSQPYLQGKISTYATSGSTVGWSSYGSANGYAGAAFHNASNTQVGGIVVNSGGTAFNTTSDYRLKDNIAPMTGALAKVSALKPVTYTWKADGSNGQGFIAHELQAVVPDCVTGEKDAINEDGTINPQQIDTSYLVATLTAAIQELNTKVTALEAQLGAK